MNTTTKIFFAFIFSGIIFLSCKKSAEKTIVSGTWMVSKYMEDAKDETSDYSGYVFDFKNDGILTVTFSSTTVNGTWGYEDSSSKYIINISGNDQLDEISDGWIIISRTSDLIELKDDNTSKNEFLTFKKM